MPDLTKPDSPQTDADSDWIAAAIARVGNDAGIVDVMKTMRILQESQPAVYPDIGTFGSSWAASDSSAAKLR